MSYLIVVLKYFSISVVAIIVLLLLYLLVSLVIERIPVKAEMVDNADIELYVLTNGVHTDLVVPVKTKQMDWRKYVKFEHTPSGRTDYKYIAFGWGDRGFYMETPRWSDLKLNVAFKAVFGIGTSAVHSTFYYNMYEDDNCIALKLSENQYSRLIEFILSTFRLNNQQQSIVIETDANYGSNDAFYEANGKYSLFYSCNTWTNQGLKRCGQKACLWTLFENGIFRQYKKQTKNMSE